MYPRNFGILAIFITAWTIVSATPVPKEIELTPDNAVSLGFELQDMGMDGTNTRMVTLKFPAVVHGNWPAKRVQTFLISETGEQLAGTSSDFEVASDSPSVFAHYQPEKYDLVFVIQYFSNDCTGYNCSEMYTMKSVNSFLGETFE